MKLKLVKQQRGTSQNTLSGPKSSWGSRETSLKSLALSRAFSLVFVTTLKYVHIFLGTSSPAATALTKISL